VRRLLIGGSPFQGRYPASEVNDGACPEKPIHLNLVRWQRGEFVTLQVSKILWFSRSPRQ